MSAFLVTESQAMLAESARKYVERGYDEKVRAASLAHADGCVPERWRELADMGWLALPLPEDAGGLGGSPADICILAEELGRGLVQEPWIACAVLAGGLLADAGGAAQRDAWLPALAAGEKRLAFGVWEPGSRFDAARVATRATRVAHGYRIDGAKELVLGAPGADAVIVVARCETAAGPAEPALFLVPADAAGMGARPHALIDGRQAAHLTFGGVELPEAARLGGAGDAMRAVEAALDRTTLAHCAETVGAMARTLEITLDYLKTRKQFGRVLASNQVLQHRLVDLHVAVEEARSLTRAAAHAAAGGGPERRRYVAAARAYVAQAARTAWEEAVQMHGAIGMTDEYVIGQFAKRLAVASTLFGDAEFHLERLARAGEAAAA